MADKTAVEKELTKALKVKQRPDEEFKDYAKRLSEEGSKLGDDDYNKLSEPVQDWLNDTIKAFKSGSEPPAFPADAAAPETPPAQDTEAETRNETLPADDKATGSEPTKRGSAGNQTPPAKETTMKKPAAAKKKGAAKSKSAKAKKAKPKAAPKAAVAKTAVPKVAVRKAPKAKKANSTMSVLRQLIFDYPKESAAEIAARAQKKGLDHIQPGSTVIFSLQATIRDILAKIPSEAKRLA